MTVGGVEMVTTSEICERLSPDVGPETVRGWCRSAVLAPVSDPQGRPVRHGREYLYRWPDVVDAEHRTRTETRGRPRTVR